MSYRTNTIHNGNLYLRCPYCGDSANRDYVAHYNIHLATGRYHCYRCGASGIVTASEYLELTSGLDLAVPSNLIDLATYTGIPITDDDRYTLLPSRYDGTTRVWDMRLPSGKVVGYHTREYPKRIENVGTRALGYVGSSLSLTSTLRVVEGVYDVVLPSSVCLYGKITKHSLGMLRHYSLCLCPDNDCIYQIAELRNLYSTVLYHPNVQYVEILPRNVKDAHDWYLANGLDRAKILSRKEFLSSVSTVIR